MARRDLMDLDECVMSALDLFIESKLPKLQLGSYKRPLVVGSGNAAVTGRILFEGKPAVFADESTYKTKLKAAKPDGAILISASGSKHAPIIAKDLNKRRIETRLLTCNPNAPAARFVDKTFVFPKQSEPYTYNTSTYLSMILAHTKEDPKQIKEHIRRVQRRVSKDIGSYNAYFLIVPSKFDALRKMFATKFDELFGPMVNGRIFTPEQTKHAKTIVQSDKELFISFGYENKVWGMSRLNISLPKNADFGALMAIGYFVIGKIQKNKPQYFKRNIERYARKASELFGSRIEPVVE